MNKHRITPLIIVGIVMALPDTRCLAQTDEPKENNVQQMQILLRTEGLDIISPELRGGIIPDLKQKYGKKDPLNNDQMLPAENKTQKEKSDIRLQRLRDTKEKAKSQQNSDTSFFREQLSQQIEFLANQGTDVQKLKELVERLQLALETSENESTGDIAVAVFARPKEPQQRPEGSPQPTPPNGERPTFGRPGFTPPMLMMQNHMQQHQGPAQQMHRPEMHLPEGPFAEDLKRIAALGESAERLAQAGMPDIAQGLRERAGQTKKELAEKQERTKSEERERTLAKMREQQEQARHQLERLAEQRRESAEREDRPALPLRELHEQLEQLRREVHSINEKVSHLTEMIEHHHRAQEPQGHHEEMDDNDDDDDKEEDRKLE